MYSGIVYNIICIRVCTNVHVYVMYAMPAIAICIIDYSILILWVYILYTGSLLCEN